MISKGSIKEYLRAAPRPLLAALRFLIIRPVRTYIRFGSWAAGRLMVYERVASHLWWLEGDVPAPTVFGAVLDVDASDIVGKHIYYFGIWEPHLTHWIRRSLHPGDIFVDVGANVGYYTMLGSTLVGEAGRVISVEALPHTFDRLKRNLTHNNARNVRAVNAAAWDKAEKVAIYTRQAGPTGSTTLMADWAEQWQLREKVEIDAKPLAEILSKDEIKNARVIKIDVEGAEWHVMSEMTSWLADTARNLEIVIEISRDLLRAESKDLEDVLQLFARFGFNAYRVANDYSASSCIRGTIRECPQRIVHWPSDAVDQIDVIFSRTEAQSL